MDVVDRTLTHWRRTQFTYGVNDCMLSIADYILDVTGIDYGVRFRGRYCDQRGALAAMIPYGGPVGLLDLTGLPQSSGHRGSVCVIETGDGDMIGGISTGDGVALRTERGVIEVASRLIRVAKYWDVS